MISLEGQKSTEIIAAIQDHESRPKSLVNFFNENEIGYLRSAFKKAYQDKKNCSEKLFKNGEPLGRTAHPKGELANNIEIFLREKLKPLLKEPYSIRFSFHRNFFPYGMHTDSGYDPSEVLYKQGIIPLQIIPQEGEVYTVIFEQKCYHSVGYPRDLKTISTLTNKEWEQIHELKPGIEFSMEQAEKLFSGERAWLKGFDIALPFRWQVGDMAIWDRAHLHCSSDFNHINGKVGLMWVTSKVK